MKLFPLPSARRRVGDGCRPDPIARILNTRTAYALQSRRRPLVAEFVDDRVTAIDERTGMVRAGASGSSSSVPPRPPIPRAFFAAVESAVLAAGGRAAASESKLARALGH